MTNKDQKYRDLVNQIKLDIPELDNPQDLTSEIMSRVEELSGRPKKSTTLVVVTWLSSVAAVLLLGIFLYEQSSSVINSGRDTSPLKSGSYSYVKPSFNNEYDINTFIKERQEAKKDRELFYSNIENKYKQIK